jgi:hypothetical protein
LETLVDALGVDREKIDASNASLLAAEQADREALAAAMRRGEDPISDTATITRAREEVLASERRHAARKLAIADASQEYRAEIETARGEWLRTSRQATEKAAVPARKQLDALASALDGLREARGLQWWLTPGNGLDSEQPIGVGGLPVAKSSAFHMANSEPRGADQLLAWLGEIVTPEPEPQTPAEPVSNAAG